MIGCLIAARVAEEYGVDRTQVYRVEADREQGQSDETKRVILFRVVDGIMKAWRRYSIHG